MHFSLTHSRNDLSPSPASFGVFFFLLFAFSYVYIKTRAILSKLFQLHKCDNIIIAWKFKLVCKQKDVLVSFVGFQRSLSLDVTCTYGEIISRSELQKRVIINLLNYYRIKAYQKNFGCFFAKYIKMVINLIKKSIKLCRIDGTCTLSVDKGFDKAKISSWL